MSTNALTKVALAAALVATALISSPGRSGWMVPALVLFGLFNAIVSPPGTLGLRLTAVAATLAALWW
jgi:hypothetical protein